MNVIERFMKYYNDKLDKTKQNQLLTLIQKTNSFLNKVLTCKPSDFKSEEEEDEIIENNEDDDYDDQKDINNKKIESNISQKQLSEEINNSIYTKNIQNFIELISANQYYVEIFVNEMTSKLYNNHSNTILTFLYAIITKGISMNKLNSLLSLIFQQIITLLNNNINNQITIENVKELFNIISLKFNQKSFLTCISKYLNTNNNIILLQTILLSIKNFVMKQDDKSLINLLPCFIDPVFGMLNHDSSDIRKHAVYCIVEVYLILGVKFEPYFMELNTSQQNLIKLFIRKKTGN